uniref:Trichohyalin-plectin-homology domain-containing protein n=1 Tax=Saimiri boliviensis boliviensis TaxID=39432 RepID=A0A2K6T3Z6_SAIBB
ITIQQEVKDLTPKVVIVVTKPPKGQSHQKHHAILASIKSNERDLLKAEWDQHHYCKFLDSLVRARIKDAMQRFILNIEERRNKLCELLYFTEMQLKKETIKETNDRMREKTKLLKEKNEKERQDCAAEKVDQQFRECCEDLHVELFCSPQKKVCEERQELVEEQMFFKLWEEDRLAKEKREAQEERRWKELMENACLGFNAQITSIKTKLLKEEEVCLKAKQETRTILQKALQERIEHIQQESREQDLNMKLMQMALQDFQEKADKKKQKREDMIREQKIYHKYLAQKCEEEKVQEKEFDRILEEDKDKKLAEKNRELRLEKEARRQLVDEVMSKKQEERAVERKHINEDLKELNCEEKENSVRNQHLAQEYRKQLQMQIAYQQQSQEAEKEEKSGVAANKICLDKIQKVLPTHQVLPQNIDPVLKACPSELPP